MNKDELIQLRKALLAERIEKYQNALIDGVIDNKLYVVPEDDEKTSFEIISEGKKSEKKAVEFYESKIEEIIRNAIKRNTDFDGISTLLYVSFFITNEMADKVSNDCHLPLDKFDRKKVYNDYVYIAFSYDFINGNDEIDAGDYLNNPNEPPVGFIVKYEKFVEDLKEKGFDIDITTFNELLTSALKGNCPTITVDLTKETRKSK